MFPYDFMQTIVLAPTNLCPPSVSALGYQISAGSNKAAIIARDQAGDVQLGELPDKPGYENRGITSSMEELAGKVWYLLRVECDRVVVDVNQRAHRC